MKPVADRLAGYCGLLLLLAAHAPGWAEDAEDDREQPAPQPPSEAAAPSRESDASGPFEVFVPSEQISEDIPVPFPVDI